MTARSFTVAVRDLAEFVLRTGDLGGGGDFNSPQRAQAGIRGHQAVQRTRPPNYQSEVPVCFEVAGTGLSLQIRGRIDGLWNNGTDWMLEEIKTVTNSWLGQPDTLHWGQAKIYAAIYARQHGLPHIQVQLAYLNLDTREQTLFQESCPRSDLDTFLDKATSEYVAWLHQEAGWMQERDQSIQNLKFPFHQYRPGQRELAVQIYRNILRRGRLFVEAPTGLGKTMAVLFPAIKALGENRGEKIFYLTAKTVGRGVAEKALASLRANGLRLRSVTLTAREKICFTPGQPCDTRTCPCALGYYDRLKAARQAGLAYESLTRSAIEEIARRHQVCPFEFALDLALWVEVIIGDYNHVFDPRAYLKRFFADEPGPYLLLVDEAHNLVDRAREMFSAEISRVRLSTLKKATAKAAPAASKALGKITRRLSRLVREHLPATSTAPWESTSSPELALNLDSLHDSSGSQEEPAGWAIRQSADGNPVLIGKALPENLPAALESFLKAAETWLTLNLAAPFRQDLIEVFFEIGAFLRLVEGLDDHYVVMLDRLSSGVRLRLFCLDPSLRMQEALQRGQSTAFFSATLSPLDYFQSILGGGSFDKTVQLPSPFASENLAVLVQDRIATRYRSRSASYELVAEAIGTVVQGRSGNYLAYFPSHQYLGQVFGCFKALFPQMDTICQIAEMADPDREAFLARFQQNPSQSLVAFAVLGGIFGEGIDLVGDRLAGVVVVGVGLPQVCLERDLIRDFYQQSRQAGFDYAYQFPGMNRVLQAVGRVIRSETDRGVVLLIDDRFSQASYRRLFPGWWTAQIVPDNQILAAKLSAFWSAIPFPGTGSKTNGIT